MNDYLREALPYHAALEGGPYEIMVLPDEALEKEIPAVRVVPTGPVGPAEKRDIAAQQASGEFLAFIDDDAYPRKDWLANALRHFDDPRVGGRGRAGRDAADRLFAPAGLRGRLHVSPRRGPHAYRYLPVGRLREIDDFPSVNLIVRKKAFEEVGGFDTHFWPGKTRSSASTS